MMRDPLIIVATLSLAGLAFFLLVEHVPKWARALAWSKPFDGIRKALAPIALPGWIKTLGMLAWSAMLLTLLAGMFFVILTGLANLPGITPETAPDLRWYLLTLTAITAALGAVIALPFTLRRTVQNERQTRTAEEGYVTQQINEAVANLAAQKEVNQIGRAIIIAKKDELPVSRIGRWRRALTKIRVDPSAVLEIAGTKVQIEKDNEAAAQFLQRQRTEIEWQGVKTALGEGEIVVGQDDWQVFTRTEANIEVRVGGILSLERLARQRAEVAVSENGTETKSSRTPDGILDHDGARDHVRIMEILCVYIRENTPASSAKELFQDSDQRSIDGENNPSPAQLDKSCNNRAVELDGWVQTLPEPRTDIQTALRVLGRRTLAQRTCEGHAKTGIDLRNPSMAGDLWHGYWLDLGATNLQGANLSHEFAKPFNLAHSDLYKARLEGADLSDVSLEGAELSFAHLDKSKLKRSNLKSAVLRGANLTAADLEDTNFDGADISGAVLEGTLLMQHEFRSQFRLANSSDPKTTKNPDTN